MAGIVRVWRDLNWLGADNQGLTRGAAEGGANQIPGALVFELVDFMREKKRLQLARDAVAEGGQRPPAELASRWTPRRWTGSRMGPSPQPVRRGACRRGAM